MKTYRVVLAIPHEKKNRSRKILLCSRSVQANSKPEATSMVKRMIIAEYGEQVSDFYVKTIERCL